MATIDLHSEAAALQWRARNDPAMWSLLKRAAASAAQATSINTDNEVMIEGLAEDIVKRASVDATVFKLLQQAATAAGTSTGTAPGKVAEPILPSSSPRNNYDTERIIEEALSMSDTNRSAFRVVNATAIPPPTPPPTVPNDTVRDMLHMDVAHCAPKGSRNNSIGGLILDTGSMISEDTDYSLPIIPIRASTSQKRRVSELQLPIPVAKADAAAPAPPIKQPAASSGQTMMEEVCTLANRPMSSEAFADRLKEVLDRYRANKLARQSTGAPPSPLPPKVEEYDRKLSLLQAAHEAGALTFSAFKAAVEDLGTKTLMSPMPAPQPEPQQVAARPLPVTATYSTMGGSPVRTDVTTGVPAPVAAFPVVNKPNVPNVPLNTMPAIPAVTIPAAVDQQPKQARNISPKPRMVSPMRPPPPMSPLPQTATANSAVIPAAPAALPTAGNSPAVPPVTAPADPPVASIPVPSRSRDAAYSASQRSHSSRVLAAQRNKIPCRTPPGMFTCSLLIIHTQAIIN